VPYVQHGARQAEEQIGVGGGGREVVVSWGGRRMRSVARRSMEVTEAVLVPCRRQENV
jgi:hypothetical protein